MKRLYYIVSACFFLIAANLYGASKELTFYNEHRNTPKESLWQFLQGKPEKNQLHFGMLSYHISTATDHFKHNWKHSYYAIFYKRILFWYLDQLSISERLSWGNH